ncbi:GntR family transcriptional regulator [Paracoccus aestuariivivens]|uniref:FCD domain-containing protein n=1 Tax=Paracoccus aestuariivivens TaxID=1820333 RepID=A0A6L6J6T9_9RHOB|nr:GntR family transcriptional regulator [Paracoccus aestuariivivens]MTH76875.1 FCD domain-containing protein [Paracoccus aestuariivivens]
MTHSIISTFSLADPAPNPGQGGTVQRVYEDLRQRIISFDLPPDMTLARNDLTEEYGVSLTPLREALQKLHLEGLVRIYPQSRTVVTRIDIPQIYEAHFLRVSLECEVARNLALARDEQLVTRARSIIRMQEAVALDPDQVSMFQELDEVFHNTLFAALGRGALHRMIRERSGHLERARRLHNAQGRVGSIIAGHSSVIDAIAAGDADGAVIAMRGHLGGTISQIEQLKIRHPDYFS